MSLTMGGFFALVLIFLLWRGGAGRIGILMAALAGASIAVIGQFAAVMSEIGTALAPVLNALGSMGAG